MIKKYLFVVLLMGVFICFTQPANAALVQFDLFGEFSGATPPEGDAPWLTATFNDEGTAGSVLLTMDATGLIEAEYVIEWLFNVDPTINLTTLSIVYQSGSSNGPSATVDKGANEFKADGSGGGKFDLQFAFPTANNVDRFGAGETVVYLISGSGITAQSFNVFNDIGNFKTAAHVGGIDIPGEEDGGSGWIATPIPTSILMLAPGLILLGALRRRFNKS